MHQALLQLVKTYAPSLPQSGDMWKFSSGRPKYWLSIWVLSTSAIDTNHRLFICILITIKFSINPLSQFNNFGELHGPWIGRRWVCTSEISVLKYASSCIRFIISDQDSLIPGPGRDIIGAGFDRDINRICQRRYLAWPSRDIDGADQRKKPCLCSKIDLSTVLTCCINLSY